MSVQRVCEEILDRFETELRGFIKRSLAEKYGSKWWSQRVPDGVKTQCSQRLNEDSTKTLPRVPVGELIDYTYIGDLKEIIVRADNYRELFFKFFGPDSAGIRVKLQEISGVRDAVRHVRPVGEPEYQRLVVQCRDIYDALGVDPPAEIGTSFKVVASRYDENQDDSEEVEVPNAHTASMLR